MVKHAKLCVLGAAICFLPGSNSTYFHFVEAPIEIFHVSRAEISKDVLKRTIGVLTLNSGLRGGTKLKVYEPQETDFVYSKTLLLKTETVPISNFGYPSESPGEEVSNYRYPIVAKDDERFNIVIDPVNNVQAWVNLDEVADDYYPSIVWIDSLELNSLYVIDIFHFARDGVREFYMNPSQDSTIATLHAGEFKNSHNKFLEQKDGYLKIQSYNTDLKGKQHELTGWVKIRDSQGLLSIWLGYADTR